MKRATTLLLSGTILILASLAASAATRLAIGTFGLAPERRNAELADAIAAQLTTTTEFELVERRELDAVLKEASLGMSGVVRANDAARLGKLLRADLFLLGSSFRVNGTNRLVIRLVDAKSGVIRAINVFRDSGTLAVAAEIATFVQKQSKLSEQRRGDFLAIGVIQNLGVNDRFPDFPAQMRGSVAAALSRKMTVLERDMVSYLANEVRMDTAGLTEGEGRHSEQTQFGFWVVDGFYQSYEVSEPEVQLKLRVERVQGEQHSFTLQGKPEEQFLRKICETIERAVNQPAEAGVAAPATRQGEIAALEARGRQLIDYARPGPIFPCSIKIRSAQSPAKVMSALDEATRVFESILLLDPENNAAKMRLAGCLLFEAERWGGVKRDHFQERLARASDYYREVISSGDPDNADDARITLARSLGGLEGVEMLRRFGAEATDPKEKQRFQNYKHELLLSLEYELPLESVLPHLRNELLDECTERMASTNEPVLVSFDTVLFAWRFQPGKREEILNTLLLELVGKFPKLTPYILLAAAGEQTTTNSPIVAQFLASLKNCEEHPESVWHSSNYFTHLSSTLEDEKEVRDHGGTTLYQRTFDNRLYSTVVAEALARQSAAEKGLAPPLTQVGKTRLAESYMALKEWKEALDVFNELPDASPQVKNECRSHIGQSAESEALPESAWKDKSDLNKVELAYQCIDRQQWSTAVAIMSSMQHRTVRMNRGGPWGFAFTPVLPAVVADQCRAKAGLPQVKDPMRFEIGETPYVSFSPSGSRRYSFEVEGEELWLAVYSQIKAFRGDGPFEAANPSELHEFQRSTPTANTSICVSPDYIFAGTTDDGLLELDRKTGGCRRLTMNDGLLLNRISGLCLQGQNLWIAYRNGDNGAVGTLNLRSHKTSTLTPNLSSGAGTNSQPSYNQALLEDPHEAPHLPVSCMAEGEKGEMWFAVSKKGLQRFQTSSGGWDTIMPWNSQFPAMALDSRHGLLLVAMREFYVLAGEKSESGGLGIYDYRRNTSHTFEIHRGLPSNDVSAVAVDNGIAWVGGRGFVAVMDVLRQKVLRIAYVSASQIRKIQLSKTHAWIFVSCDKEGAPDFSGDATTGVYRLDRAAIEPDGSAPTRE